MFAWNLNPDKQADALNLGLFKMAALRFLVVIVLLVMVEMQACVSLAPLGHLCCQRLRGVSNMTTGLIPAPLA